LFLPANKLHWKGKGYPKADILLLLPEVFYCSVERPWGLNTQHSLQIQPPTNIYRTLSQN